MFDYKYQGKRWNNVEFVCYLSHIKCDTQEADKMCAKYTSRTWNVKCLCRYCCCPTRDSDNRAAKYKKKTVDMIKKLVEKKDEAGLKDISQHLVRNAFHEYRFGHHNNQGIHGACPLDMLHHIMLGVFVVVRDCFLAQIGESSQRCDDINGLARLYGKFFAHQSDRDLPKTNFANGIFKGKIMAKEYTGVLLLMDVILQSGAGRRMLKSIRNGNFRHQWLIDDWILLVETILEWEAFLKLDKMETSLLERLKKKHRFIMFLVEKIAKRTEGMGLKTMKFHGILHMVDDILAFGVPIGLNTGSNESHHKPNKVFAKMTQRILELFEEQVATRESEYHLVDLAVCEINGLNMWEYLALNQERGVDCDRQIAGNIKEPVTGGTAVEVHLNPEDSSVLCKYGL